MQAELELGFSTRGDYTFKHNTKFGRHGWLRLTPAYSVKLVKEIITRYCTPNSLILEPFSGTATTGVAAAELGFDSILLEINPFLVWLGNLKCKNFQLRKLIEVKNRFDFCLDKAAISNSAWIPNIHNIERWWHPQTIRYLSSLRESITESFGEPKDELEENLVWVAFARLIIETSAASFNHVSMSFKDSSIPHDFEKVKTLFSLILQNILSSARVNLKGNAVVIKHDSRTSYDLENKKFDTIITSPPYPNRMSYIRELRPYMYWLKFLSSSNEAALLDWKAIGGTWGSATSNLNSWHPENKYLPDSLYKVCDQIELSGDKNSKLMSLYVHKYFDDMALHIRNIKSMLKNGSKLNYIIGNSSFYGHFVNTDEILKAILRQEGFSRIVVDTIRKRNSKKGLLEFNVRATN